MEKKFRLVDAVLKKLRRGDKNKGHVSLMETWPLF